MSNKKRILWKMALIGMAVFVISAAGYITTEILENRDDSRQAEQASQQRTAQIQKYRTYLQEIARKVRKIPVDPNIVGQIQSRYFEEYSRARFYLWAMDSNSQFQFGVPYEAFARLNRAYDAYQKIIEQEGRFTDRQDFLRRLVQDHQQLNFDRYEKKLAGKTAPQRSNQEEDFVRYDKESLVFSAPFQNEKGEMLGNLYLKVIITEGPERTASAITTTQTIRNTQAISHGLLFASLIFLWFLLPTWVYLDAKGRGMDAPVRWAVLTLASLVIGLVVYLILRPESGPREVCQNCGRTTHSEKFCPYCGVPAVSEFCPQCGYPIRLEWKYCPNCQTAIPNLPETPPEATAPPTVQTEPS
jgi:RNA polymerase subunit RPABC4/transcription elongation factor Spt4